MVEEYKLIDDLKFNKKTLPKTSASSYINCSHCQQKLSIDRLKKHQDFYCPKTISTCPICQVKCALELIESHMEGCITTA